MMTANETVNMFCNMAGAELNQIQKESLSRLLQSIYDVEFNSSFSDDKESNTKRPSCDKCGASGPYLSESHDGLYCQSCRLSKSQCDGCRTGGCELNLDILKYFGGKGMYCKYCIQANKDRINAQESRTI